VNAVRDADIVLFGADSLLADGSVINKVGTLALCCAAAHCGTRTMCASTPSKVLPDGHKPCMEEMDPGELGEPIPDVRSRNVCFERVPVDLVGSIVSGEGVMSVHRIRERAKQLGSLAGQFR
jgi:translation initiation factor 2B subunit (eIF-2B alpha/beta/delta family)